ncbi:alpha/beta hydrolase [Qingshengfaniella alkalisoli]|uniref:Alpha/beta hydrolase n=1 Tax=Qingshengfaniella alkalisoli TaxID=2599296 RepID=A0A5B8I4X5_9RHOB|nr:alpha/beta hydrolase [Qingshengfaniella alkalisoli]QDY68225.1 alpha/beta hydrolase [Qingshengfaniella alkalisoli]
MSEPTANMKRVLDRLAVEDKGLADPTTLAPGAGRALAALTNMRWNDDLPDVAEARTVMISDMSARYVVPKNDAGTDAILHVHGGGFSFCSAATHEGAARRLAIACRAPVLTIDYRLAPEQPYPAGMNDILDAWSARAPDRRWSIAGDSAGANLALCAMLRLINEGAELPAQALLFYGVYGADFNTPSYVAHADGPGLTREKMQRYWDWYTPADTRNVETVAPLHASDAQLRALPPLYLNAAGLDPLRSESETLAGRLHALGRADPFDLIDGVVHGFMQMGSVLPEARHAFEKAGEIFKTRAA